MSDGLGTIFTLQLLLGTAGRCSFKYTDERQPYNAADQLHCTRMVYIMYNKIKLQKNNSQLISITLDITKLK